MEITNLCYAHDDAQTPRAVLALYNRAFFHAYQCSVLFANPKSITRRKMFGRYFHSITAHAAFLFRIISLRLLNTEQHERMFQQVKGITKATSNNHTEQIISNIIQRLHYEQGPENVIALQEGQIKALSRAVGPMKNTVFPLDKIPEHYQAHLEQISDYLICGPGVWWRLTSEGILFLDGSSEEDYRNEGPALKHFGSTSLSDSEKSLQQQWEACCSTEVCLPATCLRYYGKNGNLQEISVAHISDGDHMPGPLADMSDPLADMSGPAAGSHMYSPLAEPLVDGSYITDHFADMSGSASHMSGLRAAGSHMSGLRAAGSHMSGPRAAGSHMSGPLADPLADGSHITDPFADMSGSASHMSGHRAAGSHMSGPRAAGSHMSGPLAEPLVDGCHITDPFADMSGSASHMSGLRAAGSHMSGPHAAGSHMSGLLADPLSRIADPLADMSGDMFGLPAECAVSGPLADISCPLTAGASCYISG